MADAQDAILFNVVGEICNMLTNVILLAPDDERIVLADFALTQVAPFTTACAETSRRNISPWITAVPTRASISPTREAAMQAFAKSWRRE